MLPPLPPIPTTRVVAVSDARAVHDCSDLPWAQFVVDGHAAWRVLRLTPAHISGSAIIPEAYIQAETGNLINPAGSDTALIKEGDWKVVNAAKPLSPPAGHYFWTEPMLEKRMLSPEDRYSPFIYGGSILTTHNPGSGGIEQFGTVVLLPSLFDAQVPAGFALTERNPALLSEQPVPQSSIQSATALLRQQNDLVAVRAFRLLLQADQLPMPILNDAVSQAQGYRLAMFIYLLLTTPVHEEKQSDDAITTALTTRNKDSIRMVALGILSAADFGPPTTSVQVVRWRMPLQVAAKPFWQDASLKAVLTLLGISE